MTSHCDRQISHQENVSRMEQIAKEIRLLIIRTTNRAGCGHTGGSLSEVELLTALYFEIMNVDPLRPDWPDRDRFVLSKGHATPGYYSILAKRGFFPLDTLDTFDEVGSLLQGHPDMCCTPGVDMSTGSLGQGLSVGIGMALGGDANRQRFYTYVLLGCGELQEGQVWEAAMYAGVHKVRRLIAIVDFNKVQSSGTIEEVLSCEPLAAKWRAFKWDVMKCDGHDIGAIIHTLAEAKKVDDQPVVVIAQTVKGKGVSFMEGRYQWHTRAPDDEEADRAIKELYES